MIRVEFQVPDDKGGVRSIQTCINAPVQNPTEHKWPWAIDVNVDGRDYTTYGMDPFNAIENAARHAALLLHGVHGAALVPPIDASAHESKRA